MDLDETLQKFYSCRGPERFRACVVREPQMHKAFALIQLVWPELGLRQWARMVESSCPEAGITSAWIAIEDPRSYIHALFFCRMRLARKFGQILRVSELTVAELPGLAAIGAALDCAYHIAARTRAKALELDLDDDQIDRVASHAEDRWESGRWSIDARRTIRYQPVWH
jgi:hypothetical protein